MKLKALIVSIKGTKLTKREKILLKNGRPWGIILFKRNLKSFAQIKNLTNQIKFITKNKNFPIIIGNSFIGSPAIVDVDSDNDLEIYIGTTASLVGLDYKLEGDVVGYWNMYHGNYKRTSFYEFDPNMNCSSPLLGDINCDSEVDVLDIMMVVDFVLDVSFPFDYQAWSSDLNSDANINIFDIISIVAIILD